MQLTWTDKLWNQISLDEWYGIAALRLEVFVIEQNCPYQDFDGKDQESLHLWATDGEGKVAAYLRVVRPGVSYDEPSIGRVVVSPVFRKLALGKELMRRGMEIVRKHFGPETPIRISAQEYLLKFYTELGFLRQGEVYLEDDIPHVEMLFTPRTVMNNQTIKDLLWDLQSEKHRMLEELESWAPEDLRQSKEGGWNALQVLEHVIGSEIGTLGYLKKKTLAPANELSEAGANDTETGNKLSAALQSTKQWKAPDVLPQPLGSDSLDLYAAKWQALRIKFTAFLDDLPEEYLSRLVFRHPIAGMLDLEQTLTFLRDHITHHMFQLDRIKSNLR